MFTRCARPASYCGFLALLSVFNISYTVSAAANSTCYYPAGLEYRGVACNPNDAQSACCGHGFVCLSNGLCKPGPDVQKKYRYDYYRSGCTDSRWNSTACPRVCIGPGSDLDSGEGLQSCGANQYCCNKNYDCCRDATNVFTLEAANIVTTIPYRTSGATVTMTPTPTPTPATSAESSLVGHKQSNDRKAIAIGAGVGIGLAILIAIPVVALCIMRRRRNIGLEHRQIKSVSELPASDTSPVRVDKDIKDARYLQKQAATPELEHIIKAHIPKHAVELEYAPRYELEVPGSIVKDFKNNLSHRI